MATWSPASVRRSGCWAVKAAGHSSKAAIQRAFMRGLLQRESVDGATGAGRGVFQDRAAGSRNYRVPLSALTSPHARMASLARRLPAVVRGRDARAGLLAAVGGRR